MLSTCIIVRPNIDDHTGPKRRVPRRSCVCVSRTLGPSPHSCHHHLALQLPRSLTGPLYVISPFHTLSFPKVPKETASGKYGPRHDSRQGKNHPTSPPNHRAPPGSEPPAGPPAGSISSSHQHPTAPAFQQSLTCTSARPDRHADPRTMTAFALSPSYLPRPAAPGYRPAAPLHASY